MFRLCWKMEFIAYGQTHNYIGYDFFEKKEYENFADFQWDDLLSDLVHLHPSDKQNNAFVELAYNNQGTIMNFEVLSLDIVKTEKTNGYSMTRSEWYESFRKEYKLIVELPYFFKVDFATSFNKAFEEQYPEINLNLIEDGEKIERINSGIGNKYFAIFTTTQDLTKIYKEQIQNAKDFIETSNDEKNSYEDNEEYSVKTITSIGDLNGQTVILEGDFSLTEEQENIVKLFKKEHKQVDILTNLYKEPEKIKEIVKYDNLIIQTTGFNPKLQMLIELFSKLKYEPKRVVFLIEVIDLRTKLGLKTELYKTVFGTNELIEIK